MKYVFVIYYFFTLHDNWVNSICWWKQWDVAVSSRRICVSGSQDLKKFYLLTIYTAVTDASQEEL